MAVNDPPGRPRIMTRPPAPASIEDRVRDLEHGHGSLERELNDLVIETRKTNDTLDTIKEQVSTFLVQRDEERKQDEKAEKKRDRLKTAALAVAGGLCLALIGWIAKIAMMVQAGTHLMP